MKTEKKVLHQVISIAVLTCLFSVMSYYCVDRVLSTYIEQQLFSHHIVFLWMTYIPVIISAAALVFLLFAICKILLQLNLTAMQLYLMQISIGLMTTIYIKNLLKALLGRSWPKTFFCNNPSWINNHAYGFHFLHGTGSFPSGHTTVVFFTATVLWNVYPSLRWLYALGCLLVCLGLLAMNYHFLADIIAGAGYAMIAGIVTRLYENRSVSPSRRT